MADKAVELLDKVIADGDNDAFVKGVFVAKRTNPAVLNKVRDGIAFRLEKNDVSLDDKVRLRAARSALYDYQAKLAGSGTVSESLAKTNKLELDLKQNGTSGKAE